MTTHEEHRTAISDTTNLLHDTLRDLNERQAAILAELDRRRASTTTYTQFMAKEYGMATMESLRTDLAAALHREEQLRLAAGTVIDLLPRDISETLQEQVMSLLGAYILSHNAWDARMARRYAPAGEPCTEPRPE